MCRIGVSFWLQLDFGQFDFGQFDFDTKKTIRLWPIGLWPVRLRPKQNSNRFVDWGQNPPLLPPPPPSRLPWWANTVHAKVGPEGWGAEGWGPEGWGTEISRFFFPLPPQFSFFLPSLGGPFRGILLVFLKRQGPEMCTFGVLGLSCEAPATCEFTCDCAVRATWYTTCAKQDTM